MQFISPLLCFKNYNEFLRIWLISEGSDIAFDYIGIDREVSNKNTRLEYVLLKNV